MTEGTHDDMDDAGAGQFVAWLAGEVTGQAAELDAVSQGPAIARAFRTLVERDGGAVIEVLRRLAGDEVSEALLEHVLAECWESIREALPARPSLPSHRLGGGTDRLVYLVLSLAPNTLWSFSANELDYLATACTYDPRLLRHLLTWASAQLPGTDDRARVDPIQVSRWMQVARWCRGLFAKGGHWHDWSCQDGTALARRLIAEVDLTDLIEVHWPDRLWTRPRLLPALAELSPALAQAAAGNQRMIEDFLEEVSRIEINLKPSPLDRPGLDALGFFPMSVLDRAALRVGWVAGQELHRLELPRTVHSVAQVLRKYPHQVNGTETCQTALLWADLQQLVDYQRGRWGNHDKTHGVLARLSSHLRSCPQAWAVSAREILAHPDVLGGEVLDLLMLGVVRHAPVRAALEEISRHDRNRALCDHAQGLLARVSGVDTPSEETRRWLADSAARAIDGVPMFPNPLTSLARTWLGATDLDETLPTAVRQAMTRFGEFARDQGGVAVEEHVVGVLLTELEVAFRGVSLRLMAAGRSRLARTISVSQRPVHKTTEEPQWGCDVALLLNANIQPDVHIELAELVQVKKSQAFATENKSGSHERWRINVPQLLAILSRSQSAGYWLILSRGELVCVTARWIHALVKGRGALARRSVTIGYNDVRHAAVPMEQFLPELFLGTWIGSADEPTVAFARGDDANVRPRHIFAVSVTAGQG